MKAICKRGSGPGTFVADSLPETFLSSSRPEAHRLVERPPRLSRRVKEIPDERVGREFDHGIAGRPGVSFVPALAAHLLAPEQLVDSMIKVRAVMDQHSSAIDQATLARFLTEGYFLTHIKRMRKLYAERREFFIEQFNQLLSDYFILQIPEAGLHFVAWLRRKEDLPFITRVCEEIGLRPSPLSSCYVKAELAPAMTFGFAAWTPAQVREGLRSLAAALDRARSR